MLKDEDWIVDRLGKAKNANKLVTDAVAGRLKELLEGHFNERQLTPKELAKIANALIADMVVSDTPKAEASHED